MIEVAFECHVWIEYLPQSEKKDKYSSYFNLVTGYAKKIVEGVYFKLDYYSINCYVIYAYCV